MSNKVLLAYVAADVVFAAMGGVMIAFCIIVQNTDTDMSVDGTQIVRNLLFQRFPLTAGIVNAIFVFTGFVVTFPGIVTPSRVWLKLGGYLATVSGVFSLIIGLYMWTLTLRTKEDFQPIYTGLPANVQELIQSVFLCCGYLNSTTPAFITDSTCPSPAAAALVRGCATPINAFANTFQDQLFTAVFGMVGIDAAFVLATACLLKERKERERFRYIDEKNSAGRRKF